MMRLKKAIAFIAASYLSLTPNAHADDNSIQQLFDMSIEELLQVKVSVGSRKEESIAQTPGVVRVFTAADIQRSGFETFRELLRHVPGVQLSESKNGHTNIWMRGVQSRNNNKVLFLVDGVPQHDSFYGNFNIDMMLPLAYVERVEILNGPGGVTYGANGFAGIINVTSKSSGRSVHTSYGQQTSYDAPDSTAQVGLHRFRAEADYDDADIGRFYLYVDAYKEDGFQPEYNRQGEFYDRDNDRENRFLSLNYKHHGFAANLSVTDHSYPYRYTGSDRWQGYEKKPISLSLSYEGSLAEHSYYSQAYLRHYDFSRPRQNYDSNGALTSDRNTTYDTSMLGAEFILHWAMPVDHALDIGVSYQRDWLRDAKEERIDFTNGVITSQQSSDELVLKPNRESIGSFVQYQWQIHPYARLTLGGRYDYLTDFDDEFNYRVGLTGEKGRFFYKALYGTSFRVPTYREYLKKYTDDYNSVNPLQPEHIKTLEFSVGYGQARWQAELAVYQNTYEDFIKEINVNSVNGVLIDSGGDEYAFNFDTIEVQGGEFSLKLQPIDRLEISATLSRLFSTTETPGALAENIISPAPISEDSNSLQQLSNSTMSLMVNYRLNSVWSFGTDATYYSDRGVSQDYQSQSNVQNQNNADSFVLLGANVQAKLENGISLKMKVDNLLDNEIYSPNFDPSSDYDVQWPRRKVVVSVGWAF